jgi:hypothetical protein
MVNLFANNPAAVVAKQTISFAAAGLDTSNTEIIFEVGSPLKSWKPERTINGVSGFTVNKGYYIVPKADINFSQYVVSPLNVPSPKKNIRAVTSGTTYEMAGEWVDGRTGPGIRSWWGRVLAPDHMNGGKEGGVEQNEFNDGFTAPFTFGIAHVKQNDDVANITTSTGQRSIVYGETDHGPAFGGTTWDLHPRRWVVGNNRNVISGPVFTTGGSSGIEQRQYEWNYGKFKRRPGAPDIVFGSLIQLDIDNADAGRARFSCLRSADGGVTFSRYTILEQIDGPGRSETEVLPVPGSAIVLAFIRLDQGGNWQVWKSTDDGITWASAGNSNLGWTGFAEKVVKAEILPNGLVDFNIMDRPTGWWVHSRNNDIIAQGAHNNPMLFNPVELGGYVDNGDPHNGLGYHSEYMDEDGVRNIIFAQESPDGMTTKLMFTRDDNIDDTLPDNIPTPLISSFVASTSFRCDINVLAYTSLQLAKWNTRFFRFGVYSDAGFTSPITAQYDNAVGPVVLDDIRLPAHFINIDLIPGIYSGTTIYVRFKAVNNVGTNPTFRSIAIALP